MARWSDTGRFVATKVVRRYPLGRLTGAQFVPPSSLAYRLAAGPPFGGHAMSPQPREAMAQPWAASAKLSVSMDPGPAVLVSCLQWPPASSVVHTSVCL